MMDDPKVHMLGRRPQLNDEIASYLRESIIAGQIEGGSPLNIDAIAREVGVSATPVREALLGLRGEGFVLFQPRRGFTAATLTRSDLSDLYWMHSELAGELAARAALVVDESALDELEHLQDAIGQALATDSHDDVERLNFDLHRRINHSVDAAKLQWMLRLVLRYVPRRFYGSIPGWSAASVNDHSAIIDALRRHDGDSARRAMQLHILHAGSLLAENLETLRTAATQKTATDRT
jgi:DNA-binding GntR family transcriptional regulator